MIKFKADLHTRFKFKADLQNRIREECVVWVVRV